MREWGKTNFGYYDCVGGRTRVLAFPGEGEVTKKAELSSEDTEGIFYGSESSGRRQVCTMYGNEMNASFYIVIQSNI